MAFHVGQKVVCVDVSGNGNWFKKPLLLGHIYTVIEIGLCVGGDPGLLVAEVEQEAGYMFRQRRFRPVIEKKSRTDVGMAILREILERETVKDPSPSKVRS